MSSEILLAVCIVVMSVYASHDMSPRSRFFAGIAWTIFAAIIVLTK